MDWKGKPPLVLAVLLALHLVAHIDRNMLLGFAPQITRDLALSNAQYGFLVGAVWVLSFGVMALAMGALADRVNRPRLIAAGVLVWSLCTWASGHAGNFGQMVLARCFVASGEAALVPAAASLLAELFSAQRRGAANGVFFMGIPLGIGGSFLLAGSYGATHGWRATFLLVGMVGAAMALPLVLLRDRRTASPAVAGAAPASVSAQLAQAARLLARHGALRLAIGGFVLAHFAFVGLAFAPLWLAREMGMDSADMATRLGGLQLLAGAAGALLGGLACDRLAARLPGGKAGFMALLVALCVPLMIAGRVSAAGSPLFYLGLCLGFLLPLALYGPSLSLILELAPPALRATMTGMTMLLINVFAIAAGNLLAGAAIDRLSSAGVARPLTALMLASDLLAGAALLCYWRAARCPASEMGTKKWGRTLFFTEK